MKERIGQAEVEVAVFGADGGEIQEPLTARERWTLEALDSALQGNAEFQKQYPGAALDRIEVMRGMDELGAGRYYLRYRTSATAAPVEFWGGLAKGKKATMNLKTGQVTVPAGSQTPRS
jgi:hypothetical protein